MPAPTLPLATGGLALPAQRYTGSELLAPLFPKSHYQVAEEQTLAVKLNPPGCASGGAEQELNEREPVSIAQPCTSDPRRAAETNRSLPSNLCLLAFAWIKTERVAPCQDFWWTLLKIEAQKTEPLGASLPLNPGRVFPWTL